MAVLKMKQIEIIALQKDAKHIVELLQRRGVVQITKRIEDPADASVEDSLTQISTQSSVMQFDKNLQVVNSAITALDTYVPVKRSPLSGLYGRDELPLSDFAERSFHVEDSLRTAMEILSISKAIDADQSSILHTRTLIEALLPWEALDIPQMFSKTAHCEAFIGSLPSSHTEETVREALAQTSVYSDVSIPDLYIEVVSSSAEMSCIVILSHRSSSDSVRSALREIAFTYPTDPTKHPPIVRLTRYRDHIFAAQNHVRTSISELAKFREKDKELAFLSDYLLMRKDKYEVLGELHFSKKTFILNGFIPERDVSSLEKALTHKFDISFTTYDPADSTDVPVLLKNNSFVYPVEDITEAYSLPSKDDVDPNPFMAFFYYLFFGMMLSDAGYGLLICIGSLFVLFKCKPEGSMKQNMQKFFYCGLSTLFWGAMYGSWFGNIVNVVSINFFHSNYSLRALWFDPVNNPLKLMIFSLILGFFHILTGMILKFWVMWKHGDKKDALYDIGLWWVVFLGLGGVIVNMAFHFSFPLTKIGLYLAAAGAVGLVLTQGRASKSIPGKILGGVASLYGITGYFSDVLSYSRLMALGLVTGIIGNVVNTIGSINGGGVGGAIMLTLVFIFGHSINIGINLLGAYVHGNRLQYVEFFSKFYEGGGKPFRPFGVHTKHFKIKEEK